MANGHINAASTVALSTADDWAIVHVTPAEEYEAAGVDVAQTGRRATMEVISLVAKPQQATVVEYGLHPAVMGRFPHSLSVKTTYFDSGPYSVAVSRSPS